jgi:hypothetical protein
VPEVDEQEEDLPECVDHQPSSFKRGKPRSILSLILYESNSLYIWVLYIVTLSETVDAFITILAYIITYLSLGSNTA